MSTMSQAPIVIYQEADQAVEVRLDAQHDTVWLTQEQLTLVFDVHKAAISNLNIAPVSRVWLGAGADQPLTIA